MKYLIIIFVLLSCNEEIEKVNCFEMTIPQGNPVKFWLNGVESFNEKVVPGVEEVCFMQPFDCDDVVNIQVYETNADIDFALQVLDSDDEVLDTEDFTEDTDYFNVSYNGFTALGLCTGAYIRLKIITQALYSFASGKWRNYGSGVDWVLGVSTVTDSAPSTKEYVRPFYWRSGVTYTFSYELDLTVSGSGFSSTDFFLFEDSETSGVALHNDSENFTTSGTKTGTLVITPTSTYFGFLRLYQIVNILGSPASSVMELVSLTVTTSDASVTSGDYEHANSDLIDIAHNQETNLIQYSNATNFAGLDYSNGTIFGIRIHSKFFKERFPEEDESEEISDGSVVKLSGSVKNQRLLQIEPCPFYLHNILKRVLQHNTIYIDGQYWEKEESYEITELNEKYPLHKAEVWLTQKEEGYDTNVYGLKTTI